MADTFRPFSSPEPVVSWSLGLETMGSGRVVTECPKFRTSGHECTEVTNITAHAHRGFFPLTAPLGKQFYFLSPLQTVDSLGCFENTGFTQLGFINNLESQEEDINKNQLNTLLGCRTEAINRQIIV